MRKRLDAYRVYLPNITQTTHRHIPALVRLSMSSGHLEEAEAHLRRAIRAQPECHTEALLITWSIATVQAAALR